MNEPLETKTPQPAPGKYLVCVNKGDASRVAVHFACSKAKKRGGIVTMLHVIEPAQIQSLFAVGDVMQEERVKEAETMLTALIEKAKEAYGIAPTPLIREGQLGDELISAILADPDVNMLVLGVLREGHGKLTGWLAGKLGDKLLVPLMLVPGNLTDQQIEELS